MKDSLLLVVLQLVKLLLVTLLLPTSAVSLGLTFTERSASFECCNSFTAAEKTL